MHCLILPKGSRLLGDHCVAFGLSLALGGVWFGIDIDGRDVELTQRFFQGYTVGFAELMCGSYVFVCSYTWRGRPPRNGMIIPWLDDRVGGGYLSCKKQ
eukprot:scaffold1151_cov79-Cyclotella_meneghiniana.AAC.1